MPLDQLATRINATHRKFNHRRQETVELALLCGQDLLDAKAQAKHGSWLPWLAANCDMSERQAYRYMKLVKLAPGANLTPEQAMKLLSGSSAKPVPDYDADQWYTPAHVVESVRDVLGSIDVDPATSGPAQDVVQATEYYTKDDDGLTKPWIGNVFCNPPYSQPLIGQFTEKLLGEFESGRTTAAVYLVNNCTDAAWFHTLLAQFPCCFTKGRISFEHPERDSLATRQGQAIFYLGSNLPRFITVFSKEGIIVEAK